MTEGDKYLKAKRFLIVVSLIVFIFILFGNTKSIDVGKKEGQNAIESSSIGNKEEEKRQNFEDEFPNIDESSKNIDQESQNKGKEVQDKNGKKKIELTDYVEFSIEEFIEKTRVPLLPKQGEKGVWNTADHTIRIKTDKDKIIYISMSWFEGNDEAKQLIESGEFPYTIAGISLNDKVLYPEDTILEDASRVSGGGTGGDYYTSLDLSRLGIERLVLGKDETVKSIEAGIDLSLKKSAENLEYIWEERVEQKEGASNDELAVCESPYIEMPESYMNPDNISRTVVWVKYPYLEIPGNLQMEHNANSVISETLEAIENSTYKKTSKNVLVQADYMITYMTSKFISVMFRVHIIDDEKEEKIWKCCNINMAKNGEAALLKDLGITKEKIIMACESKKELLDIDAYVEDYDTKWDGYCIRPDMYIFFVQALNKNEESFYEDRTLAVKLYKWYDK